MYDMLKFALDYQIALDAIVGERDMKLQKYELKKQNGILQDSYGIYLRCVFIQSCFIVLITVILALETHYTLFFLSNTQYCNGYPHHGPSRSTSCYKRT